MKMEEKELILSLIEGTNDIIYSVIPDGTFEFVNRAWLETLGYADDEWETMNLKDIVFPGHLKSHSEILGQILAGKKIANIEVAFVTKSGSIIYAEGNMFPRTIDGNVVAATGFYRDISLRKESEENLSNQRARTEFFVDLMVHDITNINQEIISTLELLLLDGEFPNRLKELVDEALVEVERSSNLVDKVRKISSLYSVTPQTEDYDLWTVIGDALKKVKKDFPDKEIQFNTNISENQYSISADEYLVDVFYSLLHNSAKFDKSKTVDIEVQISEIAHTPFIRVEVKDKGPGIPDEDKESLFEKVSHRRESIGGLGLSLSFVKMVLDNYGAYISVEDRVAEDFSKGANFVILMRYNYQSESTKDGEK
jgi:PAS domain S-box-containing protein